MNNKGRAALVIGLLIAALLVIGFTTAAPKQCNDNLDNDGDGLTDYPNDPGCSSKADNDENNCGNNVKDGSEVCDGTDLGGQTCSSQGFSGGTLACASTCGSFDTSGCFTNSCSDTDGGFVVGTQGTVSGSNNGQSFSHTDSCNSTVKLTEWVCAGTTPTSSTNDCTNFNFTSCTNGACQ